MNWKLISRKVTIIFNMKERPNEIAGIKVSDKTNYLGITINDNSVPIYTSTPLSPLY